MTVIANAEIRLVFETQEEIDEVIKNMQRIGNQYSAIRLTDLKTLCGLPTAYSDENVGWKNLTIVKCENTDRGFLMTLPIPEAI